MHRSFAVTDVAILDGFSFERVMTSLIARSGVRNVTAASLYQQWFDTQNPAPGLAANTSPHCDDFLTDGKPSFNGFSRRCPTPEGALARTNPFARSEFTPLALINRFDLAPVDGANCGQYRIIFARNVARIPTIGATPIDRLNIIFEAVLPNPDPAQGIAACRPVAQFWAGLSQLGSLAERRAKLEEFFFAGLPGFAPVVHPHHYGASGGGIRTFHWTLLAGVPPRFYQFRLDASCVEGNCTLLMQPDVLENLPPGDFFDGRNTSDQARRFRTVFVGQVASLAIADENRFFMNVPREFLIAESSPPDSPTPYIAFAPFLAGVNSADGRIFEGQIEAELRRINSKLSPIHVVDRAQKLNCVGCHLRASTPFEHLSQIRREGGEAGERFAISSIMRDTFIPHRMEVLRQFLASGKLPTDGAIGGGRVVH